MNQMTFADITYNRHGGNVNSTIANAKVSKEKDREAVLDFVKLYSDRNGVTLKEVCSMWGRSPNQISGRFTELKADGLIRVSGRRDGCGIYFISQ